MVPLPSVCSLYLVLVPFSDSLIPTVCQARNDLSQANADAARVTSRVTHFLWSWKSRGPEMSQLCSFILMAAATAPGLTPSPLAFNFLYHKRSLSPGRLISDLPILSLSWLSLALHSYHKSHLYAGFLPHTHTQYVLLCIQVI